MILISFSNISRIANLRKYPTCFPISDLFRSYENQLSDCPLAVGGNGIIINPACDQYPDVISAIPNVKPITAIRARILNMSYQCIFNRIDIHIR